MRAVLPAFALDERFGSAPASSNGNAKQGTEAVMIHAAVSASGTIGEAVGAKLDGLAARNSNSNNSSGGDESNNCWASRHGASPRLAAGEVRTFSAAEVSALYNVQDDVVATAGKGWRGLDPRRGIQIEVQIHHRPIYRRLVLPPARTLAEDCDICIVELWPPLNLIEGQVDGQH
jgi:hypothetical protein